MPELKRQGKTLIVVSHDDRYFDVADKVVRLENGKIIQTSRGDAFVYEHRTGGQDDRLDRADDDADLPEGQAAD